MKKYLAVIILLFIAYSNARAGWPIGKRHYVISPALAYYTATKSWDQNRKLTSTGQKFASQSLALYAAVGVSRRVDVSISVPVVFQSASYQGFSTSNANLGDLQVGANIVLFNFKYANYITLYLGATTPLYTNTDTKIVGLGNAGAQARLSNSGNITLKTYYSLDAGYSHYTGTNAPRQYYGTGTLGVMLSKFTQMSADFTYMRSESLDKTFSLNQLANRDYDFTKASLTFGHAITRRINVNLSGFYTLTGRNTGQGYGGTASVLLRLPNP